MRSILLLPLVARCQETIGVCIWRMFVYVCCTECFCSSLWGYMGMCIVYCVAVVAKDSVLALEF